MMYKKTFLPIKNIIQQTMQSPQHRKNWIKSRVFMAWQRLFPNLANEPKKLFMKDDIAYFQLSSLVLANSLRWQKNMFLTKIQTEITKLGLPKESIKGIVFL